MKQRRSARGARPEKEEPMQQTVAAQRRYFESGATRPLTFRLEMLTRLELGLARWEEELLAALKADLNKDP